VAFVLTTAFAKANLSAAKLAESVELFVATDGNDAWSGTLVAPNAGKTDGPFATLGRARDEIRRRKTNENATSGFVVSIRGGRYYLPDVFELQQDDSGTQSSPVVYQAYKDEKPVLIGGRVVRHFRPYRDNILQADLASQGLAGLTFTKQLFCDYIHDVFGFGKAQHHTGPWITPHYCWGVYLDDNSAEVKVYGNIAAMPPSSSKTSSGMKT
jgi:hypothetical protein